jgi:hypothetical protein
MKKKEHPIRNDVIAGLITAAIIWTVAHFAVGWQNIFRFVGRAWNWIGTSTPIKIWLLLILIVLALGCIIFLAVLLFESSPHPKSQKLPEIILEGVRWRAMDWNFRNIVPFCSACDLQLNPRQPRFEVGGGPVSYTCEQCGERLRADRNHDYMVDYAARQMQQAIREQERRLESQER